MFRIVSLLALIAFTGWILPLGAFIQTPQEKTACGGKRAFHMCAMMQAKVRQQPRTGVFFQNASGAEKNGKSSAGTNGDDFLFKNRKFIFENSIDGFHEFFLIVPSNLFLHRLDAVPKI